MGEESGSDRLEVKEAFSYGYEWPGAGPGPGANPMQGPNRWPDPVGFPGEWREALTAYYQEAVKVSETITRGLALALGEGEAYLDPYCAEGDTISLMRVFKYYPYGEADAVMAGSAGGYPERTGSSCMKESPQPLDPKKKNF